MALYYKCSACGGKLHRSPFQVASKEQLQQVHMSGNTTNCPVTGKMVSTDDAVWKDE
jgi:hypothetical protein